MKKVESVKVGIAARQKWWAVPAMQAFNATVPVLRHCLPEKAVALAALRFASFIFAHGYRAKVR